MEQTKKMKEETAVRRNYRDRVFRLVFGREEALLELYNALNNTDYSDSSGLTITTMDDVIYMNMKNDVSFVVAKTLNLYEHQSTWNPNMPLRDLFYLTKQYKRFVHERRLYSTKPVSLPTPVCIMFYNGSEEIDDVTELKLSDLYQTPGTEPSLELKVKVYNINYGHNRKLMEHCRTLEEYARFVAKVKEYLSESRDLLPGERYKVHLNYAIHRAIDECIREGILADLLKVRRDEVKEAMLTEYDEEAHMQMVREEGREEGERAGEMRGREEANTELIINMHRKGYRLEQIADVTEKEIDEIKAIIEEKEFMPV